MNITEEIWRKTFIKNTYSSIRGRGIHKCAKDLYKDLQSDIEGTTYCLKIDVHKFYPSLDHDILYNIIQKKIKDMNVVNSTRKPSAIEQLGNNTYLYNYNITSEERENQDGEMETVYSFIQVHLTGVPDYKDCIKNIIREYVSQTEEFDLINSYNKIQLTGEKSSEDIRKYTDYINLLDEIKAKVKNDFNILARS